MTAEQVERRLSLITTSSDYAALADVDLVIEAVYENLDIKRDVFRKLDLVCKPGAILASNTSYQDINLIADVTSRPQDILGLHFFSPANVMRLLEVVRAAKTAPDVMAIAAESARALGIAQREISDDEIIERCLFSLINEGARVLDEGIAYCAADIDTVFVNGYGFPATRVGPMHFANEAGLDVIVGKLDAYRQRLGSYGEMWFQVAPSLRRLAEQGQRFL